MENTAHRAIAIVGAGAILPDAPECRSVLGKHKKRPLQHHRRLPRRWDPALYYDPDPNAPDKTYSKIGGWVREYAGIRSNGTCRSRLASPTPWTARRSGPSPARAKHWKITAIPNGRWISDRTAVILGNAMAGEKHYLTVAARSTFPNTRTNWKCAQFRRAARGQCGATLHRELHERMGRHLPEVTEDTMPGELANCIAGRIANVFNFHGPNYVCDAACASAMAAISSAMEGLVEHDFDVAITGGIDRNMGAPRL